MNQSQEEKQEERWVTWSEGAETLGLKRNAFFYLVESGQVAERRTGPRNGRYSEQDILKVKARRESGKPRKPHRRKPMPITIDWLRAYDLPACLRLDQIVYQEEINLGEASVYQEWRKKNQNTSVAAFDARDRNICLGYVGLVPVANEQICIDVLAGKRSDTSITVDDIEAYDRLGAYTLLAISAVVHPDRPDLLYTLLYRHMQFWLEQYPERYIRKIYAQAVSDEGERLVQHLFMAPRPDLAYNAYELDLARPSASKIIRQFKQQLKQKAPLPPALQWPPLQ